MDEQLFMEVNLVAKLLTPKVGLHVGKDIEVVKKLAFLRELEDQSPEGPKSFQHHQPIVSTPSRDHPRCNWQKNTHYC